MEQLKNIVRGVTCNSSNFYETSQQVIKREIGHTALSEHGSI